MAAAPPRLRASPPTLPVELVQEILVRLPPDEPAWLLRASLVCKTWGGAVSSPGFRRRLHELHRTPPVLGFLHNSDNEKISRFIPTTASSFSLAAPDCRSWRALDCRHGRALFLSQDQAQGARVVLVWEPITGYEKRVPVPAAFQTHLLARAVVCAADGCDHSDCHGGPFRVVIIFTDRLCYDYVSGELTIWACMYSSETGAWGEQTLVHPGPFKSMHFDNCSSLLVGKSLLYFMSDYLLILEYDLDGRGLAVIDPPEFLTVFDDIRSTALILSDHGGLAVAECCMSQLHLWSWEVCDGNDARWVQCRAISLIKLLPIDASSDDFEDVKVLDYAEEANAIFVSTINGLFTVELPSGRARKLSKNGRFYPLLSVVSFYTPVPRREHQDLLKLNPCEEGAEKDEKTVDQTQQLFDEGYNAIKEGDFVNALEIRLPCYEEAARKCTSTVYKHGSASGSNVEDAAPSEKGENPNGSNRKH